MKEIGEYLRKAREERNLSLKEVQEITKISLRYLEAIDRGDFNGIPGEVYRKGFIANYASAVGLDPQEVLQRYHDIKSQIEEEERQVQLEKAVSEKYNPTVTLHWSREAYLTVTASIIGLLLVFSFVFPPIKHVYTQEALSSRRSVESKPDETLNTQSYPIEVYASFTGRVWVSVKSDGRFVYTENGSTFSPSTSKLLWTAQKDLVIQVGNPTALKLNFNGKDLGPLGEEGKVKILRFTPEGLVTP